MGQGFMVGVVSVVDADGNRVDTPDEDGNHAPVELQLGPTLISSKTKNGALSRVTIDAAGGGGGTMVALDTHDDFRALLLAQVVDGEVLTFSDPPGTFVYSTTLGAGIEDDDYTTLKLTAISTGSGGRAFNINAAVLPTIAALRLAMSGKQTSVGVLAYASLGDGGDGPFYWDASSTDADNGGTTIAPTGLASGRWKRPHAGALSIRWFGAKGDGSTNDAPAIRLCREAARVAGCAWYIPAGTFSLSSADGSGDRHQFFIPYDNESVFGDGPVSVLKAANGLNVAGLGWNGFVQKLPVSCTANSGTNTFTRTSHGYANGRRIAVSEVAPGTSVVGVLCSNLVRGQLLYVVNATTNTFQVASSPGGSPLSLGSNGSGLFVSPVLQNWTARNFEFDGNSANNQFPDPWTDVPYYENSVFYFSICSNVHIDRVHFRNNSGLWPTQLGTQLDPAASSDISVTNCYFFNMMDDPNKIAHGGDQSCIGINAIRWQVSGNTLINPTSNTSGRRISTAIEVHGSSGIITGNNVHRFQTGANLASALEACSDFICSNNNFGGSVLGTGVHVGVVLWNLFPGVTNEGMRVQGNKINIQSDGTSNAEYGVTNFKGDYANNNTGQTLTNCLISDNVITCIDPNPASPVGIGLVMNTATVDVVGNVISNCRKADGSQGYAIEVSPQQMVTSRLVTNVNTGTNTLTTDANHGLGANFQVTFAGSALPSGLVAGTVYFVKNVSSATTLTLSATLGGAVLSLGTTGTAPIVLKHSIGNSASDIRLINNQAINCGNIAYLIATNDEKQGITMRRVLLDGNTAVDTLTVPLMNQGFHIEGHIDDIVIKGHTVRPSSVTGITIGTGLGTPTNIRYDDLASTHIYPTDHNLTIAYDGIQGNDTVGSYTSVNNTAATVGAQIQAGPGYKCIGSGWASTPAVGKSVEIRWQAMPVPGSLEPNVVAEWRSVIDGVNKVFKREGLTTDGTYFYQFNQIPAAMDGGFYFDGANGTQGWTYNGSSTGTTRWFTGTFYLFGSTGQQMFRVTGTDSTLRANNADQLTATQYGPAANGMSFPVTADSSAVLDTVRLPATTVSTTDATATKVVSTTDLLHNFPTNSVGIVQFTILGTRTGGAAAGSVRDGAVFIRTCHIRNIAGTLTIRNTTDSYSDKDDAAWGDPTVTLDGTTDIKINAVGLAACNITWSGEVSLIRMQA